MFCACTHSRARTRAHVHDITWLQFRSICNDLGVDLNEKLAECDSLVSFVLKHSSGPLTDPSKPPIWFENHTRLLNQRLETIETEQRLVKGRNSLIYTHPPNQHPLICNPPLQELPSPLSIMDSGLTKCALSNDKALTPAPLTQLKLEDLNQRRTERPVRFGS